MRRFVPRISLPARNTLLYAPGGVDIAFAYDVRAFNTPERKATYGRIDDTAIEPLFQP
jgi:hypothetical protein